MSLSQRYFAALMRLADGAQERRYGARKGRLFSGIASGERVVEIGPGTGVNLPHLPAGVRFTGVEPNPHMHAALRRKAERQGIAAELHEGHAEALPLPDACADAAISTLVLCSVGDVARVLAEVRRVLRPGGRFLFIEHVAAAPGTMRRRVQRTARPAWRGLADGCRPDQDTGALIEQAGFAEVDLEPFQSGSALNLIRPHITGMAWR